MRRPIVIIIAALAAVVFTSVPAGGQVAASGPTPVEGCAANQGRSITYIGVTRDQPDFEAIGVGTSGYWFPQFAAPTPVTERPTGEGTRDALPGWVAPFSNFPEDPDFAARTFSQDGPARSAGGEPGWDTFTLPDGEVGRSGAIVDPATVANSNNTINRIALRGEVPATFYLHIVTDNTAGEHDPTGQIRARGNVGPQDHDDTQVEPNTWPTGADLDFDGSADSYTFRFDGFQAGDYLKVRLKGAPAPATGASFGGLLFDETFTGDTTPPCAPPAPTTSTSTPTSTPAATINPESPAPRPSPGRSSVATAGTPVAGEPTFTG